ncbi:MAG: DegT/DnrJ/EryC1/StrS family aminotransferase, partial [Chlamydiota bacterium]|nr:DegT/DnrJ/EryC1/StrS family aminotransferase [Chlamydiota bacterium]
LFGLCADMEKLETIVRDHDLWILEDAAQAFGALRHGKMAGSLGLIAALSFYPTKNLGGFGDAGMILTRDASLARRIRMLRVHGSVNQYEHMMWGWNSRLDSLQAAMLNIKLPFVASWIQKRIELAQRYRSAFMTLPLILPVEETHQNRHTYNQFVIRTGRRNELAEFLKIKGVGTAVYYHIPLHLQECFKSLGYKEGDFPNAEKASKESLALPIFPELTLSEQDYIIQSIMEFFN